MPTLEELGIDKLTVGERLALAQEILDSVAAEAPPAPLSETKSRELRRRLDEHAMNPDDVVPWEEIEAAARRRYGS